MTPPPIGGPIDVLARIPVGEDGVHQVETERRGAGIALCLARGDAADLSPATGNPQVIDACAGADVGLAPIAVVAPQSSRDPDAGVSRLAAAGALGFWLGSRAWRGSAAVRSLATARVLAAVADSGRPLLVPISGWGDASAIGEATAGLGIAVILVGAHYDTIVDDLSAAERHPHLHLETSRLAHFRAVEHVARRIGAERLLLGTGLPSRPPSAPLNAVAGASLSEEERRAILGDNAARLFGLPAPSFELPALIGATDVLDVHGHLPPTPWDVPDVDPGAFADLLADGGIGRVVLSSTQAVLGDVAGGNAAMAAACAADERLLGYVVADAGDLAGTRAQLGRWGDAAGIVGVKVHCQWSGWPTASDEMGRLFELLADHGRPVKIHVDGAGWDEAIVRLARRHPRLPIIAAHGGPGAPHIDMARAAASTDTVYMELASSAADLRTVREVVRIAGAGRLLFGSDAPLLEPAFAMGTYADAGLPLAESDAVARDTGRALFGLVPSGPRA